MLRKLSARRGSTNIVEHVKDETKSNSMHKDHSTTACRADAVPSKRWCQRYQHWIMIQLLTIICITLFVSLAIFEYIQFSTQILTLREELNHEIEDDPHGLMCNMDSCFDYSKCNTENDSVTEIYIYPDNAGYEWLLRKIPHDEYKKIHDMFQQHITIPLQNQKVRGVHVTTDPSKACLFLVPGLCYNGNRCDMWEGLIPSRLHALPYWNTYGRNHVIFDHDDSPSTKYGALDAIIVRTAAHGALFRHGFDVQMLLYGNVNLRSHWSSSSITSAHDFMQRPLLLSFKGSTSNPLRAKLYHVVQQRNRPNTKDVKMLLKGYTSNKEYHANDYNTMLLQTRFAFVPRGIGTHAYRLMEAISAGCIPILIGDGYVLPTFDNPELDWRSFSFKFAESEMDQIEPFLRGLDETLIRKMHDNVRDVYPILERGTHLVEGIPIILERIRNRRMGHSFLVSNSTA
mmetsp:Transcript_55053/g.81922  ORF Transcript_55053/g.81922 Transcript_55053/m.81922 type:complete len:457 (+) Transcript_55053:13-1383(+)